MKENSNFFKMCRGAHKISLTVCIATTLCLAWKAMQLISLYYSKPWFTKAGWVEAFGFSNWIKYSFIFWLVSIVVLVVTLRIKKQNSL